MKKEFLINVVLLVSINLLVKISYLFLIEVNVQNAIGPAEYGLFLAFFNLTYLFHFINDPGIHAYNITNIAPGIGDNPKVKLAHNLPYILGTKVVLSFIYLIFIGIGAYLLRYNKELFPLIIFVGINHIFSSIFLYIRSNFSAIGHFRTDSFLSALDKLLMLFVIGYLILTDHISLQNFILGQSVSFVIAISISIGLLNKRIRFNRPKFSLVFSRKLLKKSMPFALILLFMASYNRMDAVMIERILVDGAYQAGIYAASFRFMEASNMVVYLIAGLLLPMFAASMKQDELFQLIDLGIRVVAVIAITIALNMMIFSQIFMSIYKVEDGQYHLLIVFHMLSFICIAISYVYGTLITAKARLKLFNILLFSGVIINLILNFYLIPRNNAVGAAQATFITQLVMTIGQFLIAKKLYNVSISSGLIIRIVAYTLLLILALNGIKIWNPFSGIFQVVIGGMISIFLAFLLGVVRKDMIFALIEFKSSGKTHKG